MRNQSSRQIQPIVICALVRTESFVFLQFFGIVSVTTPLIDPNANQAVRDVDLPVAVIGHAVGNVQSI